MKRRATELTQRLEERELQIAQRTAQVEMLKDKVFLLVEVQKLESVMLLRSGSKNKAI